MKTEKEILIDIIESKTETRFRNKKKVEDYLIELALSNHIRSNSLIDIIYEAMRQYHVENTDRFTQY